MLKNLGVSSKKIDLDNPEERKEYSAKLQEFEKQFTYPLGNEKFYIQHGENNDYFSFFEKLGKPSVMVLEKDKKVIGLCCAVLRDINQQKYWYLCDFKIQKEHRGKKLYRQLMWIYFLPSYIKSQKAFAINMADPENNKLFSHMSKIFKLFEVNIKPNYLYSFTGKNILDLPHDFWDNKAVITNNGDKDIVINGVSQKLFHIVDIEHFEQNLEKFSKVSLGSINDNDSVMFLSQEKMDYSFAEESVISSFNKGNKFLKISSAEI